MSLPLPILIIVESPSKAKTISKYLDNDLYIIKSSFGHVRDLKKKELSIDIAHNFKPHYEVLPDKKEQVNMLISTAKKCSSVIIATDADREGESIGMHLCEILKLPLENTKRIVFHEITKNAIIKALEEPTLLDKNLIYAGTARRLLDRIVGFELSPVLWKYIKYGSNVLSAGRVQSVVLKIIYNRDKEIKEFVSTSYYKINALFEGEKTLTKKIFTLMDEMTNTVVKISQKTALDFLKCSPSSYYVNSHIIDLQTSSAPPPFTTSTLGQEAYNKFGFTMKRTMDIAQKLYESGKITYMRTDSTHLSNLIMGNIKNHILIHYGENYHRFLQYTTKSKNAQEAHEAIRPTSINITDLNSDNKEENQLYKCIWNRTIASQMKPALYNIMKLKLNRENATNTNQDLQLNNSSQYFYCEISKCKFDGYKILYDEKIDSDPDFENLQKHIKREKQILKVKEVYTLEEYSNPPIRYNEATLIKKLERDGIGRPSTYANIITTIIKRNYVETRSIAGIEKKINKYVWRPDKNNIIETTQSIKVGEEKNKITSTEIGEAVNTYLDINFPLIMDIDFTQKLEDDLDNVANGTLEWTTLMNNFYTVFHKTVDTLMNHKIENMDKTTIEVFCKNLGVDPTTGHTIYVKKGKFGPMLELGERIAFYNIKSFLFQKKKKMEDITYEDALEIMIYPKKIGEMKYGGDICIANGKFGKYITYNKKNYSIPKKYNVDEIDLDIAKSIISISDK